MPSEPPRRATELILRLRTVRRFRRDEDGATAIEFGLVALPFFSLIFAIIETALAFWSAQVLETAVAAAAREIYTGSFQSSSGNANPDTALINFKNSVCKNVIALFDCQKLVSVDIRRFESANDVTLPNPIDKDKNYDTSSYGYSQPKGNEIAVVRASMEYPRFVSIAGQSTTLKSGKRLIMATATFRTEPY